MNEIQSNVEEEFVVEQEEMVENLNARNCRHIHQAHQLSEMQTGYIYQN